LDRIEDFQAFVAIVDKGSLTAAAKQLGRSLQSVSRSLAALEGDLGVELVARTTRRSAATEAGLAFYRRVGAALSEIEAAKLETANRSSEAAGLLRIASSTVFAPLYVVPAVSAFLKLYPKVHVELDLSDSYLDLIENGYDLAIRLGELPDSSLKGQAAGQSTPRRVRSTGISRQTRPPARTGRSRPARMHHSHYGTRQQCLAIRRWRPAQNRESRRTIPFKWGAGGE